MKEFIAKIRKLVGTDGLLHILVSALIVFALGWARPRCIAGMVALAIGLGKEWRDIRSGRTDILHDLACDVVGIALGYLFVFLNLIGR